MLYKNSGGILRTQAELTHTIGQYLPAPGHQSQPRLTKNWDTSSLYLLELTIRIKM